MPKTFADLKVGDPVWGHRTQGNDYNKGKRRVETVFPGVLVKRAGGWFFFNVNGKRKARTKLDNGVHDNEVTRFITGEFSTSYYVYSNERAAHLGAWADLERYDIGNQVSNKCKVDAEKLYQVAKAIGYGALPDLPEEEA